MYYLFLIVATEQKKIPLATETTLGKKGKTGMARGGLKSIDAALPGSPEAKQSLPFNRKIYEALVKSGESKDEAMRIARIESPTEIPLETRLEEEEMVRENLPQQETHEALKLQKEEEKTQRLVEKIKIMREANKALAEEKAKRLSMIEAEEKPIRKPLGKIDTNIDRARMRALMLQGISPNEALKAAGGEPVITQRERAQKKEESQPFVWPTLKQKEMPKEYATQEKEQA